jgi:hypothetical protein
MFYTLNPGMAGSGNIERRYKESLDGGILIPV